MVTWVARRISFCLLCGYFKCTRCAIRFGGVLELPFECEAAVITIRQSTIDLSFMHFIKTHRSISFFDWFQRVDGQTNGRTGKRERNAHSIWFHQMIITVRWWRRWRLVVSSFCKWIEYLSLPRSTSFSRPLSSTRSSAAIKFIVVDYHTNSHAATERTYFTINYIIGLLFAVCCGVPETFN